MAPIAITVAGAEPDNAEECAGQDHYVEQAASYTADDCVSKVNDTS